MDATTPSSRDLTRITLSILGIGLLIAGSLRVLLPFVWALLWAIMIADSTWPLLLALEARLGRRRGPAVAIMTIAMLLLLFVPLYLAIATILEQSDRIIELARALTTLRVPPPPPWLDSVPVVGHRAAQRWLGLAALDPEQLAALSAPKMKLVLGWFAGKVGGFGSTVLEFLLAVIITAILYTKGESGTELLRRFFRRLAGERGDAIVTLAGKAIRAVALGIVLTALLQTAIAGVGLVVARVPFAGVLAAIVFVLCIAQLGPLLAMVPCVIWLYATGAPARGTLLLVVTLLAQAIDNVVRPVLIRRAGADLSLLVILPGVIGGLLWLGIIGLFIGPVILAVTWTLLQSWISPGVDVTTTDAAAASPLRAGEGVSTGGGKSASGA